MDYHSPYSYKGRKSNLMFAGAMDDKLETYNENEAMSSRTVRLGHSLQLHKSLMEKICTKDFQSTMAKIKSVCMSRLGKYELVKDEKVEVLNKAGVWERGIVVEANVGKFKNRHLISSETATLPQKVMKDLVRPDVESNRLLDFGIIQPITMGEVPEDDENVSTNVECRCSLCGKLRFMSITGENSRYSFFGLGEDGGYLYTCELIAPALDCAEMDDSVCKMMGNWKESRMWGEEAAKIMNGDAEEKDEAHEAVDLLEGDEAASPVDSKSVMGIQKLMLLQDSWELVKNQDGEVCQLIRHHKIPRRALFTPGKARGGLAAQELSSRRETEMKYVSGKIEREVSD